MITAAPGPGFPRESGRLPPVEFSLTEFFSDSFRFALVVTAAIFLRFCSAAPTKTEPEPWWYSPCTSKIEKLPERHERSTKVHLEHVQRALNNFLYKLKTFSRDIQKIYPKIQRSAKKIRYGKIKSLPLKKLLKPIVNSTTTQLEVSHFLLISKFFPNFFVLISEISVFS